MLPDPKEVDQKIWLENWLHILSIAYGRWKGFLDCLVESISLFMSTSEDEKDIEWMLVLSRKLFSHSFYWMAYEVRVIHVDTSIERKERKR